MGDREVTYNLNINFTGLTDNRMQQKILDFLHLITTKIDHTMATQQDAANQLAGVSTQLAKANTEIQGKIAELVEASKNTDTTPELQAAIDALVPAAQSLDDIVPDAPEA